MDADKLELKRLKKHLWVSIYGALVCAVFLIQLFRNVYDVPGFLRYGTMICFIIACMLAIFNMAYCYAKILIQKGK